MEEKKKLDKHADTVGYKIGTIVGMVISVCITAVIIVGTIKLLTWMWAL